MMIFAITSSIEIVFIRNAHSFLSITAFYPLDRIIRDKIFIRDINTYREYCGE